MIKFLPALVAVAAASKANFSYEEYDAEFYSNYVDEYVEETGQDPSAYEMPHDEETFHGDEGYQMHPDDEHYGNVPDGDFYHDVHDFNVWEEIWSQAEYEERAQTEAELMIALEALREGLVDLDRDIDYLDDCIDSNDDGISDNENDIADNDHCLVDVEEEISSQQRKVRRLCGNAA